MLNKITRISALLLLSTLYGCGGGGDTGTVDGPIAMNLNTPYSIDANDTINPTSTDPEIEVSYDPATEIRTVTLLSGSAEIIRNP